MLDMEFEVGDPLPAADYNAIVDESVIYQKRMQAEHAGGTRHSHPRFEQAYVRLVFTGSGLYDQIDGEGFASVNLVADPVNPGNPRWVEVTATFTRPFASRHDYGVFVLADGRWVCPVEYTSMTASGFMCVVPMSWFPGQNVTIIVTGARHG